MVNSVHLSVSQWIYLGTSLSQKKLIRVCKNLTQMEDITWGKGGSSNGDFQHPFGVVTDSSGKVFVADHMNHRIPVLRFI
jgi:hypothetical protein